MNNYQKKLKERKEGEMMKSTLNSNYLKWYKEIEKSLWKFFRLFDNLCLLCFQNTIKQINEGGWRDNRNYWCCCIIDNQIHDNWESINTIQKRIGDENWYQKIKANTDFRNSILKRRLPGNGPCPALCEQGCLIQRFRPITCTTQVCEKMLYVLSKLEIKDVGWSKPLQIEDIIELPEILKILYGLENKQKIFRQHVIDYTNSVNGIRDKLLIVNIQDKTRVINEAINFFFTTDKRRRAK